MAGVDAAEVDEQSLRAAAGKGDLDAAIRLGVSLIEQDRHHEAQAVLAPLRHTTHGVDAAFLLGHSFFAQERREDAENHWLVAAHAGHLRAAMELADLLEEAGHPHDAGHWLRVVADGDDRWLRRRAEPRLAAVRVAETARALAEQGDGAALWRLIRSVPLVAARSAIDRLRDGDPAPGHGRAREAAHLLRAVDTADITRVTERAARRSTRILRHSLDFVGAGAAELVGPDPVVAISTYRESDSGADGVIRELRLVDPAGGETLLHSGPGLYAELGLLDRDSVLSVRSSGGSGPIHWELLRITRDGVENWADGPAAPFPRLAMTRYGFFVGLQTHTRAIVGSEGTAGLLDLAPAGIRYRTRVLAVDPTGESVAVVDEHVLVVLETRTWNVVAAADLSPHGLGRIEYLTFAAPDRLFGSGEKSVVAWSVRGGTITPRTSVARSWVRELCAIPAWGVVAGMVDSAPVFLDDTTLEPVPTPPALIGADQGIIRQLRATPGGRFVVYGGQVLVGEQDFGDVTAIHDLRHPLSPVLRPPNRLTPADRADLAALLRGEPRRDATGADHVLAADERRVLELVLALAEGPDGW